MPESQALNIERHSLFRLHRIDQLIRQLRYPNVPELSRDLEVSTRTIERDLEFLRDRLGAPLKYDFKRRGYYYTDDGFVMPRLKLTEGEVVALYLGQKLLSQYKGTPYEPAIVQAFAKIQTFLPDSVEVDLDEVDGFLSFAVEPLRGEEEVLAARFQEVVRAIQERESLDITYYTASRNAESQRRVDPYHLRCHHGAWYLIAYCHTRKEVRIFALDRVQSLCHTGQHFSPPAGFSLEEYLGHSLGIERGGEPCQVVIRFDAVQARWIRERQWHSSQELAFLPDGSLLFKVTVTGLSEVKRWVLGFGAHAEVLAPEALRQAVAREATQLAQLYAVGP
ncbi:MAG TPA: WYL domain-containing transcriptional regulator [Firmicutes bacterium]|nr:WYL domain-containing transcriptional regulator [Bacillota bacterium]